MKRNANLYRLFILAVAVLAGCSSDKTAESKKAAVQLDKIVGKCQSGQESTGATDAALNAGGPSVYIWVGSTRYRLFLRTPVEVTGGKYYVVEGINAQKMIDSIGDPDLGKNGYPLPASCDKVVRTAWPGLPFDVTDGHSSLLRARVKRYPARPVFLVTSIREATDAEIAGDADRRKAEDASKQITVPGDKQRALLVDAPASAEAPLWQPEGGTVKCKVNVGIDGKIYELETGQQLCEAVPWSKFSYKPTVQGGKPVQVSTEVEFKFEPRKAPSGA